MRKRLTMASAVLLFASFAAWVLSLFLNAFVLDDFHAYGEVPIPGTRTLHLPEGDVKVSFHTETAGTISGGELPIPQDLQVAITPPSGVAEPEFTRSTGDTTADNEDAHIQVGVAHIRKAGDYTIRTNGKATAFVSPRLSLATAAATDSCRGCSRDWRPLACWACWHHRSWGGPIGQSSGPRRRRPLSS